MVLLDAANGKDPTHSVVRRFQLAGVRPTCVEAVASPTYTPTTAALYGSSLAKDLANQSLTYNLMAVKYASDPAVLDKRTKDVLPNIKKDQKALTAVARADQGPCLDQEAG